MMTLSLVQQTAATVSLGELAQYVANAAAIGAFVFAWRTNGRMTRFETILTEPETGVVARLAGTSKQSHVHASTLQGHEIKLENHEREIERLDRDKEPRRALQPTDVGIPDRRKS